LKIKKLSNQNKTEIKKFSSALILILLALTIMSIHFAKAEPANSPWNLSLISGQLTNSTELIKKASFATGELVQLQANVTYNGQPRMNIEVAFKIEGPIGGSNLTTVFRTAITDRTGIASIDFRIPQENTSNKVVGNWSAYCTATTMDSILKRNITLEIKKPEMPGIKQEIELCNENGLPNTSFNISQTAKIKITIYSNESQEYSGNIVANISDKAKHIGQITFMNISINNGSNIFEANYIIPGNAEPGEAIIESKVYLKSNGNEILADTTIKSFNIITQIQAFRDIAILNADLSSKKVYNGKDVNVTFTVANLGTETEQFNLKISYEKGIIGNYTIWLDSLSNDTLTYKWDTTKVLPGNYTVKVDVETLAGEVNIENNQAIAGTLSIEQQYQSEYQTAQLFSVLLVITGLFTFGLLFMFVRRQKSADQHNLGITPQSI
jgi:hypothetical protein